MAEIINFEDYLKNREVLLEVEVNRVFNDEVFPLSSLGIGFTGGIRSNEDAQLFFNILRHEIASDLFYGYDFIDSEVLNKVDNGVRVYTEMALWRDSDDGHLAVIKTDVRETKNFKKPL